MTIIGLDHVQIAAPAGCEQDARRFYGEAHPCFVAEDADALADSLSEVSWDENIPGTRRFYVSDPFGNRVEIRAR